MPIDFDGQYYSLPSPDETAAVQYLGLCISKAENGGDGYETVCSIGSTGHPIEIRLYQSEHPDHADSLGIINGTQPERYTAALTFPLVDYRLMRGACGDLYIATSGASFAITSGGCVPGNTSLETHLYGADASGSHAFTGSLSECWYSSGASYPTPLAAIAEWLRGECEIWQISQWVYWNTPTYGYLRYAFSALSDANTIPAGYGSYALTRYPQLPNEVAAGDDARQLSLRMLEPVDGYAGSQIESLQCSRRLGASTWLTATIGEWSLDQEQWWQEQIGATLLVVTVPLGGEFLRAILTEVASASDAFAGSITLTARVQTPGYVRRDRGLRRVISESSDSGRRSVVADVDPTIRPNDRVIDGAVSWVVGAVSYSISPRLRTMQITEAL